ncbi:MAG: ABC transporter ATP-binding protein [Gammaproteobacteria bacterium]|nr:MAG: ABC transporter ATP-binding protein [Gammaproteobacteria bacterium]
MKQPLLKLDKLSVRIGTGPRAIRPVDDVSFTINKGETYALLGESGCGKSMTALSIMRLLPQPHGQISAGQISLEGTDLTALPEVEMRQVRGRRIAMIFQEPMTSLNPVLTIGNQIGEMLRQHQQVKGSQARNRVLELLDAVGIPDVRRRYSEYPHQLSGGMKQRVMIAIALAGEPDLLIADEPTTALDVTIQAQVLDLLRQLQRDTHMAILLITHDLGIVAGMADHVAVMYAGQLVEEASRDRFFADARHPYSQRLFESLPNIGKRDHALKTIPGFVPVLDRDFTGCHFAERCDQAWDYCRTQAPAWDITTDHHHVRCHLEDRNINPPARTVKEEAATPHAAVASETGTSLLSVRDLKVHFPIQKGVFKRTVGQVYAVDGVSLDIPAGHTQALVGESGCGKTTVGKGILQLIRPTAGSVQFDNSELTRLSGKRLRRRRTDFQFIFQDPYSSMNPRMRVGDIVEEGMIAQVIGNNRQERRARVNELFAQVGLSTEHASRYPHEFSGGQRQRICIARALAVNPRLIICDEPTSALDISVQAQILNLLKQLQNELGLSYLFITHNLSVVSYLADRVAVMYLGRIVEEGPVASVLENPLHPYTRALLSAVPQIEPDTQREIIRLEGDIPSPANPPGGCHFHPRCPSAMPGCRESYPAESGDAGHRVRCFLYN